MMIKLAPSLLLSVLCCPDGVAAFNAVRPAAVRRDVARPSMTNDFDADYDVEVDRRGNIQNIAPSEVNRRAALARFAATATAGAVFLGASQGAVAATPEFSPSPVSEASIARMGYDGKTLPPPPAASPAEEAPAAAEESKPPASDAVAKPVVGVAVDRSRLDPEVSLPTTERLLENLSQVDPRVVAGTVALFSVMALAGGGEEEAPAAEGGEGEEAPAPSWALPKPTPYGIQNANGANPFLKEVLEYCEGGKVSEPCAESIKGYLDDVAETGAAATDEEAEAIAGYLDSLGEDEAGAPAGKNAGAAFTSYLDALSAGSAPPPSSAKAVKTYLDVLSGAAPPPAEAAAAAPPTPGAVASAPEPAAATPIDIVDLSEFDDRITSIEGRVTSLEAKVDQIPDQVFAKIEAWQSSNEERLTGEVKKIVEALTLPPSAEPVVIEAPPTPEPVAEVPIPEPEPVPAAPLVPANPIGAIPMRSSMPQPTEGGGPKKRYGFGGGAWKTKAESSPAPSEPAAAAVVPELVPEPAEAAPVVPATPIGAIPMRSVMPQPMEGGGPKKAYGFGSKASWKTGE